MGRIFEEVLHGHLYQFPQEREAILPFQAEFDITWATRRSAYGSEFSAYILRPEKTIRDLFGLGMEVALFIFNYPSVEARTFQAINVVLDDEPLKQRVEPASYFLVTSDANADRWISDYLMRIPQSKSPIPLSIDKLKPAATDRYRLRDLIAEFAYRRDLFDYKLPIDNDIYFFGRDNIVSELVDQIKKGQNTGVFGLRKTGKTSLIYKITRNTYENGTAKCIYIDCKSPIIRKKSAEELLSHLTRTISQELSISASRFDKQNPYEAFEAAAWLSCKKRPVCIIFDEIEYISPYSLTDVHWKRDFIDFWQLLWSVQSQVKNLSFILCGVNATICETDSFDRIQNPLFGIVAIKYLHGLDPPGLRQMVQHFGGQMGLHFSDAAVKSLQSHYGGHPLLTRMACSYIHKLMEGIGRRRPIEISNSMIEELLSDCDRDIAPYCAHIVSELRDFYPIEYDVIEMSAIGLKHEFAEFGADADMSRHLRAYGIVSGSAGSPPEVTLPVLRNYLRSEFARRSGGKMSRQLVGLPRRETWVREMIARTVHDLRTIFQNASDNWRRPFGGRGIPDSDLITSVPVASNEDSFRSFITPMYKVLYENIKRGYAEKHSFFGPFKEEWPDLFSAIDRVRTYRDVFLHLDVSASTKKSYEQYLQADLDGADPRLLPDGWFALQQAILDELLYATQLEAAAKGS